MTIPILLIALQHEQDLVSARHRARQLAQVLGFTPQDTTRIATAVSEIARNAFAYATGGKVQFLAETGRTPAMVIRITDEGPGIADIDQIVEGRYRSKTGMGLGITGARRLMDGFSLQAQPGGGTEVVLRKNTAQSSLSTEKLSELVRELASQPQDYFDEVRQQNQELLAALAELQERQEELARLNRELEDTNRGVLALYSELAQKNEDLLRANQTKGRFLSHMSHEFRTPLNAIMSLTGMLLKSMDGAVSGEEALQISYIRRSASELTAMVDDLLDLAKVEAGKMLVHTALFDVGDLFAALRGMFRPLATSHAVQLAFDEPEGVPPLHTDESKVAQILRNFLSNALKFTEHGEVRLSATYQREQDLISFKVRDTGIGIAPQFQERIFEEFAQIDSPAQRRVRGTGLGLPLCKKLAELLGGSVSVESTLNIGSTFTATFPRNYAAPSESDAVLPRQEITHDQPAHS